VRNLLIFNNGKNKTPDFRYIFVVLISMKNKIDKKLNLETQSCDKNLKHNLVTKTVITKF
jgi:hypothetical protein